jgi:predicted TIM-barrel fold metal-dependent hydrolase
VAHLAGSGGYDDPATDAAILVFINAIAHHDPRVSHLYFDISGVAGLGDWEKKKQLIASRIREVGVHRILFGSDGAWTTFTPLRAETAFHELPLTGDEFRVIDTNVPPYMPATRSSARRSSAGTNAPQ